MPPDDGTAWPPRAGRVLAGRLEPFDHHQSGEQVADLFGQLGVPAGVLGERRVLAAPLPLDEFFGEQLDRIAVGAGARVGRRHVVVPRHETAGRILSRSSPSLVEETRHAREGILEPLERADVAVAGRRLGDPQDLGRLVVIQLLKVAEREDLAIDRVHGVKGILKPELELGRWAARVGEVSRPRSMAARETEVAWGKHRDEARPPDLRLASCSRGAAGAGSRASDR